MIRNILLKWKSKDNLKGTGIHINIIHPVLTQTAFVRRKI